MSRKETLRKYAASHKGRAAQSRYESSPKGKYRTHMKNAFKRGIPFYLTFEQWWAIWEPHWENKHRHLCMSRFEDKGAYEVGNVHIITLRDNVLESRRIRQKQWEQENAVL